jgi:hypothetical protein
VWTFLGYYKYFLSIIDPINLYGVLNLNKIAELGQNGPNQANEWIDVLDEEFGVHEGNL